MAATDFSTKLKSYVITSKKTDRNEILITIWPIYYRRLFKVGADGNFRSLAKDKSRHKKATRKMLSGIEEIGNQIIIRLLLSFSRLYLNLLSCKLAA